jgi:hypothetical protein
VEDQVVGELGDVAPDHPPHAQWGEAELVARGADRLHPRQPEVPQHLGRAERREERSARTVDVEVDVQAGVGLQLVECRSELGHRLVAPRVGHTEGRHHEDRVLVDELEHVLDAHVVVAGRHPDLSHLDVPVLGELVPHHLHRTAHHVRSVRGQARRRTLLPPTPLRRHAGEHAGLGGPDAGRSHRVGRVRGVPEVGEHVHAAALQLGRHGVLVLVDQVLVDALVHECVHLRLLPRLAEGGQVLAGVAVEHQLVVDRLVRVRGGHLPRRELVLRHGTGQILASEHRIVQVVPDGLAVVKAHGLVSVRWCPSILGSAPTDVIPRSG